MTCEIRPIGAELDGTAAYRIYKYCMFAPTPEKYAARVEHLRTGPVYGCFVAGALAGILALSPPRGGAAEIVGIAVASERRGRGLGARLIAAAVEREHLSRLTAETDDDAVGFYRRCGFQVEAFTRTYGDAPVVRWQCVLIPNSARSMFPKA